MSCSLSASRVPSRFEIVAASAGRNELAGKYWRCSPAMSRGDPREYVWPSSLEPPHVGPVAQWEERASTTRRVPGSRPGGVATALSASRGASSKKSDREIRSPDGPIALQRRRPALPAQHVAEGVANLAHLRRLVGEQVGRIHRVHDHGDVDLEQQHLASGVSPQSMPK